MVVIADCPYAGEKQERAGAPRSGRKRLVLELAEWRNARGPPRWSQSLERTTTRLRSAGDLGTYASERNRRSDGGLDERLRHGSGDGVDRLPARTVGGYHATHTGRA